MRKKTALTALILFFALILGACSRGANTDVYPVQEGDYNQNIPYEQYIDAPPAPEQAVFDVRDYGAVAGAETAVTQGLQDAIDACAAVGGGTVLLAGGEYHSGTIFLKSGVSLFIAADAELVALRDFSAHDGAFIRAVNAENITITGGGKIRGEGEYFVKTPDENPQLTPYAVSDVREMKKEYYARIRFGYSSRPDAMIWLRGCKKVDINNICLRDSMHWTLKIDHCADAEINNLVIDNNRHVANTDGVDIVGSQNVNLFHAFISTADDGIVLKNPKDDTPQNVSNIHVWDCVVQCCTNAFKIGSETYGDINNVLIEDIEASLPGIYPGSVSGISIESMDGACVSDITVRRFKMDGVTCPLFVRLGNRNRYHGKNAAGQIRNITVEDVTAKNAELPMIISGFDTLLTAAHRIENVTLRGFDVTYRDNNENIKLRFVVPESAKTYPENWRFKDVPAYGLYARHVDGLTLKNVEVIPRSVNTREQFVYEDVPD
ncbi:MAG: hypothetical protein LBT21_02175 [Oscillospiraceae bacterium]|jgi:polygalacturonase|nr:hypothetical protein [Oscillospiraceae bacterium]